MSTYQEYLKILELTENASLEDIKNARKEFIKVWHPDRFENDENLIKRANRKTQEINEAYSYLIENYTNTFQKIINDNDFSENTTSQENYDFDLYKKDRGKPFHSTSWIKVIISFVFTMVVTLIFMFILAKLG